MDGCPRCRELEVALADAREVGDRAAAELARCERLRLLDALDPEPPSQ